MEQFRYKCADQTHYIYKSEVHTLRMATESLYRLNGDISSGLKSFQYEMAAIFTESLVHNTLFNTVVYGSKETCVIMHNLKNIKLESTEILEIISFFVYI